MKLIAFLMVVASATCFAVADDVLVLDENGHGTTGRFRVLDHEGEALGLMVSAEEKFIAAASVAHVAVDSSWIRVTIDCPVPEGMEVTKSVRNAWDGDGVELFIRPSMGKNLYYQYSANAAGVFEARRNWVPDVKDNSWRTAATATVSDLTNGFCVAFSVPFGEVFKEALKPGDVFGINFTRCGKTCSGMSTWAAVGSNFSNIDAFGMVVFGGGKAYFSRRVDAVRAKADAINAASTARKAIDQKIAEAAAAAEERGNDASAFWRLEQTFADIDKSLISAKLAGKSVVMFRPNNPWSNRLTPTVEVSPLESLRIRSARNTRALAVFAAANLTDEPFVGEFKVSAVPSEDEKGAKRRRALTRHLSFSQGFAIADRVGRAIYDPILPLPLNGLLRLAPNESVPIYVELDTHGLEAGMFHAELVLKKAMPGFTDETTPLTIEVVGADLDEVTVDRAGYDYVGNTFARGNGSRNVAKFLVDRGYNVVFMTASWMFPKEQKDGSFAIKDLGHVDSHLDAVLAGGLPRERMKLWIYMGMEAGHPWNAPLNVRGQRCVPGDEKWEKGVQALVREFAAHVRVRYGIGKDRIYWYPIDEPSGEIDDPTFKSSISRAYHAAKAIKEEDAANLTMTDPLPVFLESNAINKALPRLAEVYDVIELYRPKVTEEKKRLVAAQNLKEVWTYSIISKSTPPAVYRRDYWQNMRDGYREIATFWHMTAAAGSPFDSNDFTKPGRYDDYASLYVDFASDAALLSRRQLAADMGFEETRLVMWLRNKFKDDAVLRAKVDAIVKESADAGTMSAMSAARDRLLDLAGL